METITVPWALKTSESKCHALTSSPALCDIFPPLVLQRSSKDKLSGKTCCGKFISA